MAEHHSPSPTTVGIRAVPIFRKLIGDAERGKDAQGTIKILMDTNFTLDLAHIHDNIEGAQLNIGVC